MTRRAAPLLAATALLLVPLGASAHPFGQKPVAFIARDSTGVTFEWVIAPDEVRVLATHLKLGPIRPEALADAPAMVAYLRERVALEPARGACEMARVVTGAQVPTGWSLRTRFECGAQVDGLLATVTLLHDVSPDYVTLFQAATTAGRARGAFTAARPAQRIVFTSMAPPLPSPSAGASPRGLTARVVDAVQTGRGVPLALVLAFVLGAAHALAPGHGKAIAAAVIATEGGRRRAVVLALTVAGTHLLSVGVLSAIVVAAGAYAIPRSAQPVLQGVAGAIAIAIGARLLTRHGHDHPEAAPSLGAGIVGGLVPSPGAVTLALVAFAAGRWVTGVVAIAAFSAGLAAVVLAVALAAERGRVLARGRERALRRASAAVIVISGLALLVSALFR